MPTKVDNDWYNNIHQRLLSGDPVAGAELAEAVIDDLVRAVEFANPTLKGSEIIYDSVCDALISYIKRPEQYDPSKRKLKGFLIMSAQGDLMNALKKEKNIRDKEYLIGDVEVLENSRNIKIKPGFFVETTPQPETMIFSNKLRKIINQNIKDPTDQKLVELILNEERSTEKFANVLGITDLDIEDQRRIVKQNKDRIKVRLKRIGHKLSGN